MLYNSRFRHIHPYYGKLDKVESKQIMLTEGNKQRQKYRFELKYVIAAHMHSITTYKSL